MHKGLSLQLRLTLLCTAVMIAAALVLTWAAINSSNIMVEPLTIMAAQTVETTQAAHDDNMAISSIVTVTEKAADIIALPSAGSLPQADIGEAVTITLSENSTPVFVDLSLAERVMLPSLKIWENSVQNDATVPMVKMAVSAQKKFALSSALAMVIVIGFAAVLTYLAAGRALRPVRALAATVGEISAHNLSTRVAGFGADDEIKELADSFNTMLDRLESAFISQKNFATSAAHELKTPLAAIRANIEVLALDETPDPAECRETLAAVGRSTERLIGLVNDLLQIHDDSTQDFAEIIATDDLLAAVLASLDEPTRAKKLTITTEDTLHTLRGNYRLLYSALHNLVENAVKYTPPDGKITITAESLADDAVITVADNGVGIAPEHLPYIFDAFYRTDDSRSRQIAGSGLGLALVKTIMDKHHGQVCVYSKPGEGSTFTLILPQKPSGQ